MSARKKIIPTRKSKHNTEKQNGSLCSGDQKIEQPSKKKKIFISKRLVNSIDAALDEVNYDQMRLTENNVIHTGYLGSAKKLTLREFI